MSTVRALWVDRAMGLYHQGKLFGEIGIACGVSAAYARRLVTETLKAHTVTRPQQSEVWLGAAYIEPLVPRRPIVIPEAETVHAAPGLWVTK